MTESTIQLGKVVSHINAQAFERIGESIVHVSFTDESEGIYGSELVAYHDEVDGNRFDLGFCNARIEMHGLHLAIAVTDDPRLRKEYERRYDTLQKMLDAAENQD